MATPNVNEYARYVSDITLCPICLEDFQDPRSLPCLHMFCLRCIRSHCGRRTLEDDPVSCPVCREEFRVSMGGVEELRHNFFVDELVSKKAVRTNVSCGEDAAATCSLCEGCGEEEDVVYCLDCKQRLCQRCGKRCQRIRTGAHKVVKLGEELQPEHISYRGNYCDYHDNELVKMYCAQCMMNVCTVCFAVKHQGHRCLEINEFAGEVTRQVRRNIDELELRAYVLNKGLCHLDSVREKFITDVGRVERSVRETADRIKRLVDSEVSELLQQLQSAKMKTDKKLMLRKEQADMSRLSIESFLNYSKQLIEKGSICDITRAAKELNTRATELLKNEAKSIAVPTVPHIEFKSSKTIDNLMKFGKCVNKLLGTVSVKNVDQWSPLNPEGKRKYDRDFMLQLQYVPASLIRPANLPQVDIVLNEPQRPVDFTDFTGHSSVEHGRQCDHVADFTTGVTESPASASQRPPSNDGSVDLRRQRDGVADFTPGFIKASKSARRRTPRVERSNASMNKGGPPGGR